MTCSIEYRIDGGFPFINRSYGTSFLVIGEGGESIEVVHQGLLPRSCSPFRGILPLWAIGGDSQTNPRQMMKEARDFIVERAAALRRKAAELHIPYDRVGLIIGQPPTLYSCSCGMPKSEEAKFDFYMTCGLGLWMEIKDDPFLPYVEIDLEREDFKHVPESRPDDYEARRFPEWWNLERKA